MWRPSVTACTLAALLVAGPAAPVTSVDAPSDATAILSQMREAIGATALVQLRAFSFKESFRIPNKGRMRKGGDECACILPDRCIRVASIVGFLVGWTYTWGFNGDRLVWFQGKRPKRPPEQPPSRINRRREANAMRREFNRLVLPLVGAVPFERYDATVLPRETTANRPVDVVALTASDGDVFRLRIDTVTHLPAMLGWTDWSGDHERYFSDFRQRDGLLWPRVLAEYGAGQLERELSIQEYQINPRLDERRFQPVK